MERTAILTNNKGVTLIEMMFALVILLIMSLALMKTALLGISVNVQNALRDEAVGIAEMRINQLTNLPFTATTTHPDLQTGGGTVTVTEAAVSRDFRGFRINYTPTRRLTQISATSIQITMSVAWNYRDKSYTHEVTTMMRRQ